MKREEPETTYELLETAFEQITYVLHPKLSTNIDNKQKTTLNAINVLTRLSGLSTLKMVKKSEKDEKCVDQKIK